MWKIRKVSLWKAGKNPSYIVVFPSQFSARTWTNQTAQGEFGGSNFLWNLVTCRKTARCDKPENLNLKLFPALDIPKYDFISCLLIFITIVYRLVTLCSLELISRILDAFQNGSINSPVFRQNSPFARKKALSIWLILIRHGMVDV